jgi:hypothetical protein
MVIANAVTRAAPFIFFAINFRIASTPFVT